MILQVLLACVITSLVSTHEFEEPLRPQFNLSYETDDTFYANNWNSSTSPDETHRDKLYDQNDTSTADTEIRRYSEADELRENSKHGFTEANITSLTINDKTGDNGTDDAMLNKEPSNTDKEFEGTEESHGTGTTKRDPPAENVSLTSNPVTGSIDGERTVLINDSGISVSTGWSKEIISAENIAVDGPSEERRDSSTATSQLSRDITVDGKSSPTNESSNPNGHDTTAANAWETTELSNTSVASEIPDDVNLMKEIEAAAFKLYVGAAVLFGASLLVTIVVGLTLWTRRQRALRRELALKRMSQRSQVPQLEKLCSMAAFAAATDGAELSRTLTRTATVGRRPQGPRPAVTAASMPLLQDSNTEDLAQIRKEMFGDVRTWAPERRASNPPSRNFFK